MNIAAFTGVVKNAANTASPDAEIDLTLIDLERQVRSEIGDIADLATSINDLGVLEPVLLLDKDNGRYRLIAGERRFRACLQLEKVKIPAIIKRDLTNFQIRQIQVTENNDREDLSVYDEAMGVTEDVENFGFKEAQRIWNRSEGWISKRMAVKTFAEPVRELLKKKICGDLEVLHSLNQLHNLNELEFSRMERRLKEGMPLARDEARNVVSTVKAFKKQETEFNKRREMQISAKNENLAEPSKAQHKQKVSKKVKNIQSKKSGTFESRLQSLRTELFKSGGANQAKFTSIINNMVELGRDMNETEWVLWSGFLTSILPIMDALGENRTLAYVKKLQTEFKTKTPILMWRELHSITDISHSKNDSEERDAIPVMPENWRF